MTPNEIIEVIQAHRSGEKIEHRLKVGDEDNWCAMGAAFGSITEAQGGALLGKISNAALRGGEAVPLESTVMQQEVENGL